MQYIQTDSYIYVNVKFVLVEPPRFSFHKLDSRFKWEQDKDLKKENEPLYEKKKKKKNKERDRSRQREGREFCCICVIMCLQPFFVKQISLQIKIHFIHINFHFNFDSMKHHFKAYPYISSCSVKQMKLKITKCKHPFEPCWLQWEVSLHWNC